MELPTITLRSEGRMNGIEMDGPDSSRAKNLETILKRAIAKNASDVHFVVGLPPVFRVDGELVTDTTSPLNGTEARDLIYSSLSRGQQEEFERDWQLCVSIYIANLGHFRVTLYYHASNIEASIRICPLTLRTPDELGLPNILKKIVEKRSGLILITDPTGSGKTTTFNCILDMINRQRRCKMITVEDPVEFIHDNRLSIIVQQQIHSDAKSFSEALVHILRQDPDVIGVGEMRDLETISTALTAAETGHLVIATLHTPDAAHTIGRIIDVFPGEKQQQVLIQLASSLQAIIAQQLIPRVDQEGRVLATEVLIANTAVKSLIRERKMVQLRNAMETGSMDGMHLMDRSLQELYHQGIISYESALIHSHSPDMIQKLTAKDG